MYNILYILIRCFGSSRVTGAHSVAPFAFPPALQKGEVRGVRLSQPVRPVAHLTVRRHRMFRPLGSNIAITLARRTCLKKLPTGARFLRAILPASVGPGPTAGSVDPGLRIAFFRHFGPSRSEAQMHLVFRRTRGTVVPRRPKVHFRVGEDTISFADVAPATVLAWP